VELESPGARRSSITFAVVWNGIILAIVVGSWDLFFSNWQRTLASPGLAWYFVGIIGLLVLSGLWCIVHQLWVLLGREEWTVTRNRLEVRQRLFGVCRRRVHVDKDLQLERMSATSWWLCVGGGIKRQILLMPVNLDEAKVPALFDLADLLGARTGWRVRAPERDAAGATTSGVAVPIMEPAERMAAVEAVCTAAIDPELGRLAQAELDPDERLCWVGRPDANRVALLASPMLVIAVPWTLFSLNGVRTWDWPPSMFSVMPAIFAVVGVYMCCQPAVAYLQARRTVYAITDRRVMILLGGKRRSVESFGPSAVSGIERKELPGECGDLVFARKQSKDSDGRPTTTEVKLVGIPRVREVERLMRAIFGTGS